MLEAQMDSSSRGLKLLRSPPAGCEAILSEEALAFVAALAGQFGGRIADLLAARHAHQARYDAGEAPDFLPETADIRAGNWCVAPIPEPLRDRRVEITGPVDRKMIINGLNSGARVFMADFEDATTPSWDNLIQGQQNLHDAVRGEIDFTSPEGKRYAVDSDPALLIVRVRGLHLPEGHVELAGEPIPGALLDFGLHYFHNAHRLHEQGRGPWYYIPKLEHYEEARLWADVFRFAEERFGLPGGSIKATVLIETLPAVFQMHEILHAMRHHIVALNCGRWDYIFSYAKVFHAHPDRILPDRHSVGMSQPFLRAYSRLLIETCHRRGALAMGGMAAQIPVRDDPAKNDAALEKVRVDKDREAGDGHDGTWVAHPGLVPVAKEIFDAALDGPNQLHRRVSDSIGQKELLAHPEGGITEAGLRNNVEVGILYIAQWLSGRGCVPIHHLMEDAATAEIARAQLWQWIHHPGGVLEDDRRVTAELVAQIVHELDPELRRQAEQAGIDAGCFEEAVGLFSEISTGEEFVEFLTLKAYEIVAARG